MNTKGYKRKDVFSVKKTEDSSGFLLWQVTSLWQRSLNRILKKHDLTHAQFVLLASTAWLNAQSQSVSQVQLANHAKMDVMLVSNILKTLEEKKLIRRAIGKTDTRSKIVTIMAEGIDLSKKAVKDVEAFDRKFFSVLKSKIKGFNKELLELISKN